jgi:cytosine deaminase
MLLHRARVPLACLPPGFHSRDPELEPWAEVDIHLDEKLIRSVAPSTSPTPGAGLEPSPAHDLGGVIVFPGLLDCHTHLDKTHTWQRAPNPTGEFWDAITALGADGARWTEEDVYRRASYALQCAYAHGTIALRTHLDTWGTRESPAYAALARLRTEWADRLTLQTVTLCNLQAFADGEASSVIEFTAKHRATALGGFPQPNAELPRQLDHLLSAARELGIGLDLHVDESGLAHAECLRAVAEAVLRHEFPHPVACGHNCSLSVQDPARAASTLDLVRAAGIHLITLPLCNLYLQGRSRGPVPPGSITGARGAPRTPHWRGLMPVHEALDRGIPVAASSDNVRDAFYAWGDYDLLEVLQQTVRIGHLDTRLAAAPRLVTTGPAAVMGLPEHGRIAPGAPAALVITAASTLNEFLARPAAPRRLLRQGRLLSPQPPPYAALA